MDSELRSRALIAAQLGVEVDEVDDLALVDLALALGKSFGVVLSAARLARLATYSDLLRLLREALEPAAGAGAAGKDLAACFVRVRIVSGGRDGRVAVVRVGWLTPDLAAGIVDDVRHAAAGTWVDVLVPDDLSDAAIAVLAQRLRALVGARVRLAVRHAGVAAPALGPIATPACDHLSRTRGPGNGASLASAPLTTGTALAHSESHQRFTNQRRSQS
ncbi:MAG: hypothetical protein ACRERC_10860 [Candidatus Binatia bacterium]